jgi:hypothetical protein
MADKTEKQTPAPDAKPDSVRTALESLKKGTQAPEAIKDIASVEDLRFMVAVLQNEVEKDKQLQMSEQQRGDLRAAIIDKTERIHYGVERYEDADIERDKYSMNTSLDTFDQRCKTLEEAAAKPSYVPEWAKPMVESGKAVLNSAFENSKGTFAMIGGFFGKKWESSKDVLKSMKGFFFGALKGDIGKNIPFFGPQIARWAEREYFQESVLAGIRQAVKDKKIPNLIVTLDEASWNPTDSNALIKRLRLHDPAPNADMQSTANDFARQFIEEQAKGVTLEKPKKVFRCRVPTNCARCCSFWCSGFHPGISRICTR